MPADDAAQVPGSAAAVGEALKPKRAVSAYWLFTNEIRENVTKESREKNGGKANIGAIAKEMSSRWATLSEADKQVYEAKAAKDKERHAAEFAAYLEASDPAASLRKKHQDMIPKKPMSAYSLFSQDPAIREKAAEALKAAGQQEPKAKELSAKLNEMWKAASAEEKSPFEERGKKDHADFVEKQKAWQATPEFAEIEKAETAQEEKKKAAEVQQHQEEASEAKGKKRGRPAAKEQASPKGKEPAQKKAKESPQTSGPKQTKKSEAKNRAATTAPEIDQAVVAKAAKLGLESALRNLAGRPEIIASGKQSSDLLAALQASNGLVHPARRALLGA